MVARSSVRQLDKFHKICCNEIMPTPGYHKCGMLPDVIDSRSFWLVMILLAYVYNLSCISFHGG